MTIKIFVSKGYSYSNMFFIILSCTIVLRIKRFHNILLYQKILIKCVPPTFIDRSAPLLSRLEIWPGLVWDWKKQQKTDLDWNPEVNLLLEDDKDDDDDDDNDVYDDDDYDVWCLIHIKQISNQVASSRWQALRHLRNRPTHSPSNRPWCQTNPGIFLWRLLIQDNPSPPQHNRTPTFHPAIHRPSGHLSRDRIPALDSDIWPL